MEYVDNLKKLYDWSQDKPRVDINYAIKKLEYYGQELFKYAHFQVEDEVEIAKDLKLKEGHGWYNYKDRLAVGCRGIVKEIDHYGGVFRYAVTMDPQTFGEGYFTISEETLKPKGWDFKEN